MNCQAAATILFLGIDPSPLELIQAAIRGTDTSLSHEADWGAALKSLSACPPKVLLVGQDIPASDVRLLLESARSYQELKNIPSVLLVSNASRESILEFITIGIRSYVLIPCQTAILRKRLACYIPSLADEASPARKSIGERLRQRMERKMMQDMKSTLQPSGSTTSFPPVQVVEQIFSENFGLTIRESERLVSLYEKIDELKLRMGGDNSHLVGIIIQLLSAGKVRIGFREKTERLCLADTTLAMSRNQAVTLVDSYLEASTKDKSEQEPNPQTCRLIVR